METSHPLCWLGFVEGRHVILFVCFVNLMQARVIRVERISVEKIFHKIGRTGVVVIHD